MHGTPLDPQVSGVLPMGFGDGTKALEVLLYGPKDYEAFERFYSFPSKEKLKKALEEFTGEIYQKPPQRSAVLRQTRTRTIYELELLEQKERLLLLRILCEAGTYIRKLIYDIGEILGPGATMIELRRTRVHQFTENSHLVTLHELANAYSLWTEKGEVVALAKSLLSEADIKENTKGYAFETKRIIMAPSTYPKRWHSKQSTNK